MSEARPRLAELELPNRPWLVLAPMMLPDFEMESHPWAELETRRRLCRLALIARRDGFEAAQAACAASLDPFDDQPLKSRVDPDGTLVLWSVGPDGTDQGAPRGGPLTWGRTSVDIALALPAR